LIYLGGIRDPLAFTEEGQHGSSFSPHSSSDRAGALRRAFQSEGLTGCQTDQQNKQMLVKTALGLAIFAVAQAPVRLLASVMVLRRSRRTCPELFDGQVCAAAVAACVEEYQRAMSSGGLLINEGLG
jgi:hypothetical protein